MNYFVYLIGSIKDTKIKTYVGYTNNLKKRLALHNTNRGARSTKGRFWKIFYYKKYKTKEEAMTKEYNLKKNQKKRKLIISKFLSTNPL